MVKSDLDVKEMYMDKYPVGIEVKNELGKKYEQALEAVLPRECFILLFEYVDFIEKQASLKTIIENSVIKQKELDQKEFKRLESIVLEECKRFIEKTEDLLSKSQTKLPVVNKAITTCHALINGNADSTLGYVDGIKQEVDTVVSTLEKNKKDMYETLFEEFGGSTPGFYYDYSYDIYAQERHRIERTQLATIWYPWTELSTLRETFLNLEAMIDDTSNSQVIKSIELYNILQDFNEIFHKEEPKKLLFIKPNIFRGYLKSFHGKFTNLFSQNYTGKMTERGKLEWYDNGKAIYTTPAGKVKHGKFKIGDNPYGLMNFLIKNPTKLYKPTELSPHLKVSNSTDERKVRDTLAAVRKEFKIIDVRKNKADDLFDVEGKLFGLNCNVELKR